MLGRRPVAFANGCFEEHYGLKSDIALSPKSANNGSSFSRDHLVGERKKRQRDREAERRSLGSPHGLAPGLVRGFQRFTSQKNVFRPMGWSKLAISFWCDGLVRERLDRRRTANVAADVAAAIAIG